jgi:hypothetical protein
VPMLYFSLALNTVLVVTLVAAVPIFEATNS